MTHKPIARPRETPSGMLVDLGDATRCEGALPTVGLQVRTLSLHATGTRVPDTMLCGAVGV